MAGKGTFRSGIHPDGGKELSMDQPVRELVTKGDTVYPMSQHIGAPAAPLVKKGDRVLVGQKIGEAGSFVSANVFSSVSGTVKAVEPRLMVSGEQVMSVIVENDGLFETVEGFGTPRDWHGLSPQDIRSIVKEAGIVGMGGAGFPTHVKISPKDDAAISYVIVNGAECEPYLTSDYRMMLEAPEQIVEGLRILLSLFDNARGVIAVEDNKPRGIQSVRQAVGEDSRISVMPLKTKYPQGAERMLIYAVSGRKINSSMLPSDAGCIVCNVDTTISIYRAVCENKPLIRRIITVTGDAVASPCNFSVRTGTSYQELIDAAGGFKVQPEKIISGGPMMGIALFSTELPVTKTSSALTCFSKDMVAQEAETPCIRCGRCVSACPEHLIPQKMMDCAENFDEAGFEALQGMECCECGSCTFVCPAKRQLTQAFRQMRRSVMASRKKKG
ncbi:electron transport complex subunit RsxC [Cuneatibacter caecimuris]|uniref:Ion-translocating oxidoreductase complex subunit C n=1 Tax=Cuneatibacter caecimuris TaxID=1796618 RepID=A0A4Q7P0F9_9FIRM|nr:electron transport complex subunit RsxC [Cuneatibacter caecimuris]RZS93027.1 electron transport complex protein RnfC [Cuneatibacter caecimuris]